MFKDKLKELRRKKGLSQQELADKIYVSRSAICKWEMGNGVPSEINIESLCTFFEVDEEWLFDREDLKEGIKITKRNHNVNIANIILIVLIILTTYFSFKLNSTSADVNNQSNSMNKIMVIVITIMSVFMSAALGIYWITTNLFTVGQNLLVKRSKKLNGKVRI